MTTRHILISHTRHEWNALHKSWHITQHLTHKRGRGEDDSVVALWGMNAVGESLWTGNLYLVSVLSWAEAARCSVTQWPEEQIGLVSCICSWAHYLLSVSAQANIVLKSWDHLTWRPAMLWRQQPSQLTRNMSSLETRTQNLATVTTLKSAPCKT